MNDFYKQLYDLVSTFTPQNVVFKEFAVANQIWYKNTLCFELHENSTVVLDKDDLRYTLNNNNENLAKIIRNRLDLLWSQFKEAKEKENQERILKIMGKIPK